MKKIILDARKVNDYGIGEYIKTLFPAIINSEKFDVRLLVNNENQIDKRTINEKPLPELIRVKSKNYSIQEHFEIPHRIKAFEDFYYFSPHYVFPYFVKNRLIVTIHDLIHFKFPQYFRPGIKVKFAKAFIKKIKRSNSVVFTVSENSKKDLVELFGFDKNSIRVIYNGLPDIFFRFKKGANPKPFPYIMFTGNFKPHKNIKVLLDAFRIVSSKFPELRLILAGVPDNIELSKMTEKYKIRKNVVPTGYIPVEELINLIDFSELFVFPSLYEGFGFPPLEAMSRRKATISTKCGSLHEILGDSVMYFDPRSSEDLAVRIMKVLTDTTLRTEFEEKGFLHSSKYTKMKMISEYLSSLDELE